MAYANSGESQEHNRVLTDYSQMKDQFIKAVRDGDIITVRSFLTQELKYNPTGKRFKQMRLYAGMNVDCLYDPHDGKSLDNDKSLWNEQLLENILKDLDKNFSNERLNYLADVAAFVLNESAMNSKPSVQETDAENNRKI